MSDLQEIKEILYSLEKKITEINNKIDKLDKKTEKMDNHIDFVEDIYSSVSSPLNFLKNKIESTMGYENSKNLPITYTSNKTQ